MTNEINLKDSNVKIKYNLSTCCAHSYHYYEFDVDEQFDQGKYLNKESPKKFYIIIPMGSYSFLVRTCYLKYNHKIEFKIDGMTESKQISSDHVTLSDIGFYEDKIIYYYEYAKLSLFNEDGRVFLEKNTIIRKFTDIEIICIEAMKYFFMERKSCDTRSWMRSGELSITISSIQL